METNKDKFSVIDRPTSLSELVGLELQIKQVNEFLYNFQKNIKDHKKACLLVGHQGTGKSSLVECVAHDYGYRIIIEVNGSVERTGKNLLEKIEEYSTCSPRGFENSIIFIDEADGLAMSTIRALPPLIKKIKHPIFLTANNEYPLERILDSVIKVQFSKHDTMTIETVLRRYTQDEQKIHEIIHYCDGDIRAALNMLESIPQKVFTKQNIVQVVDNILSGKEIDGDVDIPNDALLDWLEENAQYRLSLEHGKGGILSLELEENTQHWLSGTSHLLLYQNLCNASRLMQESPKYARKLLLGSWRLISPLDINTNEQVKVLPPSLKEKERDAKNHIKTVKSLSNKLPFHTRKRFESDVLPILRLLSKNEEWLKNICWQCDLNIDEVALLLNVPKHDIAVVRFMKKVKEEIKTQSSVSSATSSSQQTKSKNSKLRVVNTEEV